MSSGLREKDAVFRRKDAELSSKTAVLQRQMRPGHRSWRK